MTSRASCLPAEAPCRLGFWVRAAFLLLDPKMTAVISRCERMNITVILCTFNRCQSLVKALSSVALSRLPESVTWEVLVVDNNSCDQTREVVEDFCARYPGRFRYLFESEPGKSHALNRGIAEARGDVLAFMDDDVMVDPMWLQMLTAALLKGMWAGCGGRILAEWNCPRPRWLPESERPRHGTARCLRPRP